MKKRQPEGNTTNNIILNDKELEVLIRQLVKKTQEKGACITWLNRAIATVWKEENPAEESAEYSFTVEEEVFAEKVKKFLKYYEQSLVSFYNFKQRDKRFVIEDGDNLRKERFFDKYYQILCSIYAVFEREDSINISKVAKYARHHFTSGIIVLSEDIEALHKFIYTRLYFLNTTELPEYSENYVNPKWQIRFVEEFDNFKQQYRITRHTIHETAVAYIWFINHYF